MNIDRKLVRQAIATITAEIKEMKARKRESHQPRWKFSDEWVLLKAKQRATLLCCIQAATRRRLHHMKDLEKQNEFLVGRTTEFERKQAA